MWSIHFLRLFLSYNSTEHKPCAVFKSRKTSTLALSSIGRDDQGISSTSLHRSRRFQAESIREISVRPHCINNRGNREEMPQPRPRELIFLPVPRSDFPGPASHFARASGPAREREKRHAKLMQTTSCSRDYYIGRHRYMSFYYYLLKSHPVTGNAHCSLFSSPDSFKNTVNSPYYSVESI